MCHYVSVPVSVPATVLGVYVQREPLCDSFVTKLRARPDVATCAGQRRGSYLFHYRGSDVDQAARA